MPGRLEERVTAGPVRVTGTMSPQEAARAARPLPGPQYAGETRGPVLPPLEGTRGARSPHAAMTVTHTHEHGYGPGTHTHEHAHRADASHSHHRHAPGQPDNNMPSVALNAQDPSGDTRDADMDVSGIGLGERISRFLAGQGVDVRQAVREAGYARERAERAARDRVQVASDLAYRLRKARRAAAYETNGWQSGAAGFDLGKVTEARQRVSELDEALREACLSDPEVIREVTRRAGR